MTEQMTGKIVSLSEECAEVCIVETEKSCGNCSACPVKNRPEDIIKVSPVKNAKIGQFVFLHDDRNWINKNKATALIGGFISGVIIAEALSKIVSFGAYRPEYDFIGGGIMVVIMMFLIKATKPNYFFRMELTGEETRGHD